jgi:sugar/nucleoside kinase (ribokinase family)
MGGEQTFFTPAFPLEEVFDPTGAGDAFAGGFMGYLARADAVDTDHLRRAMVYGSTMGSYSVSGFAIRGFEGISPANVEERVRQFADLTHVPLAEPSP